MATNLPAVMAVTKYRFGSAGLPAVHTVGLSAQLDGHSVGNTAQSSARPD
jgi:hypothetical protein